MEEPPSPSSPSRLYASQSSSSMSTYASLLDMPSSVYMREDGSIRLSAASLATNGSSEKHPESPIPYDILFREYNDTARQSQSRATLLQLHTQSNSIGTMNQRSSDLPESNSVISPSSAPQMSLSISLPPSANRFLGQDLGSPTPSQGESAVGSPRLRHVPSIESLDDRNEEAVSLPPPRHPIQPRPEEGNEALPDYSCSVFRSAIVNRKLEYVYPGLRAKKREWVKVYAILLGTVLRMYLTQPDGSLSINFALDNPYREYTLQYAEAGIATDYVKRKYVLRVRAEGEQFLIQCSNEEERDSWVEAIQAGSSIALALEDRNMPKYITLPRRRRGHYSTSVSRSRPTLQRTVPARLPTYYIVPFAPTISTSNDNNISRRTISSVTLGSEDSISSNCNSEALQDPYLDPATALALCLDAGRSRPNPRERLLISMLTARQHRQYGWVIINGTRRKVNKKTGELEDPLPESVDPVEDQHRRSRRRLSSRIFNLF